MLCRSTTGPAGPFTTSFVAIDDLTESFMPAMDGPVGLSTAPWVVSSSHGWSSHKLLLLDVLCTFHGELL